MPLKHLQDRLYASVKRSALLNCQPFLKNVVLDCSHLETLQTGLATQLLDSIQTQKAACSIHCKDAQPLYDHLERKIRRPALLAQRETGSPALFLGYPLLQLQHDGDSLLAPILLYPVRIETDLQHQSTLKISHDNEMGAVRHNPVLWVWAQRKMGIKLPVLMAEASEILTPEQQHDFLVDVMACFSQPPSLSGLDQANLQPITPRDPAQSHILNSVILGYMQAPNAALLNDLDQLQNETPKKGPLAALLKGRNQTKASTHKQPAELDRYLISAADFSQMQAIWQARLHGGLVIHGPPGTGKSQTIVNIIADALAHEQKVLMVCQKPAALDVVMARLKAAGLGQLCSYVRNAERDRLSVFKSVRNQIDSLPEVLPEWDALQRSQAARLVVTLERELDQYAAALHQPHPQIQISYQAVLARAAQIRQQTPTAQVLEHLSPLFGDVTAAELEDISERVRSLGHLYAQAEPWANPWTARCKTKISDRQLNAKLRPALSRLRQLNSACLADQPAEEDILPLPEKLSDFSAQMQAIQAKLALLEEADTAQLNRLQAWLKALLAGDSWLWQAHEDHCLAAQQAVGAVQSVTQADVAWSQYCEALSQTELQLLIEHAEQLVNIDAHWWRNLSPAYHQAQKAIQAFAPPHLSLAMAAKQLLVWLRSQQSAAHLQQLCQTLIPDLAYLHTDTDAQVIFVQDAVQDFRISLNWCREMQQQPWLKPILQRISRSPLAGLRALEFLRRVNASRLPTVENLLDAVRSLECWLDPSALQAPKRAILAGKSIDHWLNTLESGLEKLPALQSLDADRRRRSGVLRDAMAVLEDYENTRRQTDSALPQPPASIDNAHYGQWWEALLRLSAAQAWQTVCEEETPALRELTPQAHADKCQRLARALEQKRALEVPSIIQKWLIKQLPLRSGAWKKIFQLRGSRYQRAHRLREAIQLALPEGLLDLRPCWLSTPDTAAQMFPLQADLFDIVIFDEASQCPLELAVSVIQRGKRLVVCGDEKQLPPTRFFSSQIDWFSDDEQDNSLNLANNEDVLQAAMGCLPETYLRVHYRSHDPALIQFSNHAFYHGLLEAPPSTQQHDKPIYFNAVNGLYQNRSNFDEAEAIVQSLQQYWLDAPNPPSIGVISFNQTQRDLIEDRIEYACQNNPAFAKVYQQQCQRRDAEQDQQFFVKNLETAQGDERDVILFSTTFGTDKNGRFLRQFGPLSASGGERRLNVAITRARLHLQIFSSLPIAKIADALHTTEQPSDSPSAYLQLYLAYAELVSAGDTMAATDILSHFQNNEISAYQARDDDRAVLREAIASQLRAWGYRVESQIGNAGFQLDLVVHSPTGKGFCLGIECDDGAYISGRNSRLHEVWRPQVLQQHGWSLYRIWGARWWMNNASEIVRLKARLATIPTTKNV